MKPSQEEVKEVKGDKARRNEAKERAKRCDL